ncbi:glycosyltransferase [Arundinibacter roseus]|uniref:Glycosyltransferase family 2 protein n=1 Tax=Arundinibacter roseus TaxID=2070510 RepID=A0A4R4K1F0_9BACT|nr:glycosyltransferase [Arundinibacter roseus]TDB59799.1 glycosyltransferase family 2 protein [Arundinibacter roseus]
MNLFYYIWLGVQLFFGFNLIFPWLIGCLFFLRKKSSSITTKNLIDPTEPDYAIIVTAYEQMQQIPDVLASLLKLNYSNYLIYVVADKCDVSGFKIPDSRVILLRPEEVLSSNTKSHFYAISRFQRPHERLTIIDSDNLTDPDYLNNLNPFFDQGYQAVQGYRKAKNLNTTYACLDAARDMYYHFFDGEALFGAGSSATLAGSGMAFTTALYRECLEHLTVEGAGFDKVLQYEIVRRGHRIAFAPQSIVYDEKTTGTDQLVKQRARWINTWFRYFSYGYSLIGQGITGFNWNKLLFGLVLQRPPLFIFLILSVLFLMINLWIAPWVSLVWLSGLILFATSFFAALVISGADERIYRSLRKVPSFIFFQLLALAKVRKANQVSVATRHGQTE